jgi:hypothetical protein
MTAIINAARASNSKVAVSKGSFVYASKDATGTHGARATSHIDYLSPNHAAKVLHRRLHVSLDRLKKLVSRATDASPSLAKATELNCDDYTTASAKRLSHKSKLYTANSWAPDPVRIRGCLPRTFPGPGSGAGPLD